MQGYEPWGEKMQLVEYQSWVSIRDLMVFFNEMDGIDFSVQEGRRRARASWTSIKKHAPFSQNHRFPETGLYVNVARGEWHHRIMHFISALDYKDAEIMNRDWREMPQTDDQKDPAEQFNSASSLFRRALANMRAEIRENNGIFGRASFEERYGLTWKDQPDGPVV